jgi:hypothetical protein
MVANKNCYLCIVNCTMNRPIFIIDPQVIEPAEVMHLRPIRPMDLKTLCRQRTPKGFAVISYEMMADL